MKIQTMPIYEIPFGIDANPFLDGINKMDEGVDNLGNRVKIASDHMQDSFKKAGAGAEELGKKMAQPAQSIFNLTEKLRTLQSAVFTEKDLAKVRNYNREIEDTRKKLDQLSNAGRTGFDDLGNKLEKTTKVVEETGNAVEGAAKKTNILSKGFGFLRQAAYLIPGIGLAGIFNLIGDAVIGLISQLFKGGDAFDAIAEKTKILSEVSREANKSAASQIVDLRVLYETATNVALSTDERTKAAKALQATFPDTFAGISTENILLGKAKGFYDNLTASILENAKAAAARNKLVEISAKLLDIEDEKRKINTATFNESQRTQDRTLSTGSGVGGFSMGTNSVQVVETKKEQDAIIEARRVGAIKEKDLQAERLNAQAKFLVQFAGGEQKIAKVIEDANKNKITAMDKGAADRERKAKEENDAYLRLLQKLLGDEDALRAKSLPDTRAAEIAASDAKFKKLVDDSELSIKQANVTEEKRTLLLEEFGKLQTAAEGAARQARLDINKKYDDRELKLREDAQKALAKLGANDLDEQINKINQQFDEIKATVEKGGLLTADAAARIEGNRNRAISDARIQSGQKLIKDSTDLAVAGIKVSEQYAKKGVDVEIKKQIAILRAQEKGAEDSLALLLANGKTENDIEVKNAEETIANIKQAIKNKESEKKDFSVFDSLFGDLTDEEQKGLKDSFTQIKSSISEITSFVIDQYQKQIDAKQKLIDAETDSVNKLEEQLQREKDLRDQGFANNVDGVQAELDAKKAQREKDLADQAELQKKQQNMQKAQLAIDTATQVSGLITSSVNIFKALSPLGPIGVGLAIGTIGLMLGAFITAKIKAFQAVGGQKLEKGGRVTGKRHSQGGQKYVSADGSGTVVELEDGEHVTNRKQSDKYADLLDAINSDDLSRMKEEALRDMFHSLGIRFSDEGPQRGVAIVRERDALRGALSISAPNDITDDVKEIKRGVSFMADKKRNEVERWEENGAKFERKGNKTTKFI